MRSYSFSIDHDRFPYPQETSSSDTTQIDKDQLWDNFEHLETLLRHRVIS